MSERFELNKNLAEMLKGGVIMDVSNVHAEAAGAVAVMALEAPYAVNVGDTVDVLLEIDNRIVACRQRNMLATAFHPEITNNLAFHEYFVGMVL